MRFAGRRALVTGGANGIGRAVCEALAAEGADLVLVDRDVEAGRALADAIGARAIALDATETERLAAAVAEAGPFAVLINNVGADQHSFFTRTDPAEWRRLLDVNLLSVLACTHGVLPGMQAARYGRIVSVASEAGRLGSRGGSVYAAAKGGIIAFTKSIARENARYGITANVVAPGPIRTPMLEEALVAGGPGILTAMTGATQMNRLGEPEEVAAAILFLASAAASYVTGETLGVSGGMGMGG